MAKESKQEQETYDIYLLSLTCEHNTYIVSCGVPHVNTAFIAYQFMWHPTYENNIYHVSIPVTSNKIIIMRADQ